MNTNAVAYKKIGDAIKKRFKKTKFAKNNPNMFKGGDVKIHPGAKKDSSKDSPKNKKAKLKVGKKYTINIFLTINKASFKNRFVFRYK